MNVKDIEKLNAIFSEVYEKDIFIGIAKGIDKPDTEENNIIIAVGTQGISAESIVRSKVFDLTSEKVSDIITGIVKLKEDVLDAKGEYGKSKSTS